MTDYCQRLESAILEVLKRWDALGVNKDDDFGEVQEAMEIVREIILTY